MLLLAGMDEAGLGPLLGPLVIGWSVLRLPTRELDPWRALEAVVASRPGRDRRRLAVADSKVVFSRNPAGRRRLELAALSFDSVGRPGGRPPQRADELVFGSGGLPQPVLRRQPWYAPLSTLPFPREVEPATVELWAAKLRRALGAAGLAVVETGVRPVPSGELNASFRSTGSKAATHWEKTVPVLRGLWERHAAAGELRIAVDRLGACTRYGERLARAFPDAGVEELAAGAGASEYSLAERRDPAGGGGRRSMRVVFAERAEDRWFPVALASCLAKYARELCMDSFNEYFCGLQPDLKPTAGYSSDGERWLREAGAAVARLGEGVLVRAR